ncbi:hypothetical protein PoB_001355100 [Plakobranchus ocellatus]|uniref:Uncharacterized protein n=1 Tax=Plakobranchus ocellatus TaxID=259542 RepID=A0AAV3YUE1_9GAST|nr:hypothetical protein PoB_001355100 [Plakobranchus ocellatus]
MANVRPTGWASKPLKGSVWQQDRVAVSAAANLWRVFLYRAMQSAGDEAPALSPNRGGIHQSGKWSKANYAAQFVGSFVHETSHDELISGFQALIESGRWWQGSNWHPLEQGFSRYQSGLTSQRTTNASSLH